MATLINLSDIGISIVGTHDDGTQYRHRLPPTIGGKRGTCDLPNKDATHWTKRTKWLKQGKVMLKTAPTTVTNKPSDTPTETVEPAPDDTVPDGMLTDLHWRTAVTTVHECNDLDVLETMHETEERPRVKEAIEARMEELRA